MNGPPKRQAGRSGVSIGARALSAGLIAIGCLHFLVGDLTWWGECITVWPTVGWMMLHAERLAQFTRLRDLISETLRAEGTSSAVLCDDFNSPGGIQSSLPLRAVMRDIWPEGGRGWGATAPSWLPMSRIDQCWVTPDIEVRGAVVRRGSSDHRRLVVDLAFR